MMMKKASSVNSPPGRVPGRASDPSRSRDGDDGGYRLFRGYLIGYLGCLYRRHLIGERGGRGGALGGPHHPLAWARPSRVARWCGRPLAPLRLVFWHLMIPKK